MDEKSLEAVEYRIVRGGVAAAAYSELGRSAAREMAPFDNFEEAARAMSASAEAMEYTAVEGNLPLDGISDIGPLVERVGREGILTGPELATVGAFLRACRKCIQGITDTERYPILTGYTSVLDPCRELAAEIAKAIDEEGRIRDDATPVLAGIRKNIARKKEEIREAFDALLRSPKMKKWLQEPIVTQRGGRYVVPARTDSLGHVRGVVHGHSSSGVTAFVEPMAVVEMNNELEALLAAEEEEEERILRRLSYIARENSDGLATDLDVMTELDFIAGRAGYASLLGAEPPILDERPVLDLRKARHPTLVLARDGREVVPIDIEVGKAYSGMIISGPNAGGKTVALKTAGLLTAMALSGVPIPAKDSRVGFFREMFADIGDESSIEGNLSTFTAHTSKALKFLGESDEQTLVLIDEIGVGTSPKYGTAIAEAVLKRLISAGALVIATTHYDDLKLFAIENESFVNAAVEFDPATLAPTYNLKVGRPGSSEALAILAKVGFTEDFLREVEEGLGEKETTLADLLTRLEAKEREVTALANELKESKKAQEKAKTELEDKLADIKARSSKLRDDAYKEAIRIVKDARNKAALILRELREAEESRSAETIRAGLAEVERELREKVIENGGADRAERGPFSFGPGDWVIVRGTSTRGQVVAVDETKGRATVVFGSVTANADLMDLEPTDGEKKAANFWAASRFDVPPSINFIGTRVEDALLELDKYLDRAVTGNLPTVEIIHGYGTGALRDAIRRFLKSHPAVKSFGPGPGGNEGVTVAELKL